MIAIIIVIIVLIIIFGWIHIYNTLVNSQTDIDNSWSQIDVQLKRRNDLIPNLVSTTKGYANFESNTLTRVTKLRGQMVHISVDSNSRDDKSAIRQKIMQTSNQLSGALKSLFAVSERYPDLKANQDFQKLMSQLTYTEDKIAYARQLYNNVVARFNASIRRFPNSIVAGHKFTKRDYLKTPDNEKETPKVDFSDLDSNK